MKRVHLWVTGLVQGVHFRAAARRQAQAHNVQGWVRNLPDGRVEAVLQGEAYGVDAVVQWCHHGPPRAKVRHVEIRDEAVEHGDEGFLVVR